MKIIIVEGNEIFLDDEDYTFIIECYDLKMNGKYVRCQVKKKWKRMGLYSGQLQKVLMNPIRTGRSIVVDHKDGNEKNNQKGNLRICTHQQNMWNRKLQGGSSKYKGVSWYKKGQVWKVQIRGDAPSRFLGYYNDELAAANCYNHWAKKLFGEFALLNDCEKMTEDDWMSKKVEKEKTSKYKGVSFVDKKWLAQIYHEGKNIVIGRKFDNEIDAARAYNQKAVELKGSKAKLNKVGK